jgi:hypothetical protein
MLHSDSKSYQPRTDSEHIGPLLDTMHYELTQLPGVFTNKVWSRFVSVEPTTVLEQSQDAEIKSIAGEYHSPNAIGL